MTQDEIYMSEAIELARNAAEIDEVPVGAIIVRDGEIIARAYNRRQTDKCATAHAEILAIEEACRRLGGWRLPRAVMYVTLEPCPMCAGALINARVERVVYGASDIRFGAMGSLFDISKMELNHKIEVTAGVLAEECRTMLSDYFKAKRVKKEKTDGEALS
ncbi:MAG: tRNA adenosine(34) deaminase TadA [Clostridia bacterium]|nr:tRNA adenosine(34) deaminase TadA [Clostridia bacterium]